MAFLDLSLRLLYLGVRFCASTVVLCSQIHRGGGGEGRVRFVFILIFYTVNLGNFLASLNVENLNEVLLFIFSIYVLIYDRYRLYRIGSFSQMKKVIYLLSLLACFGVPLVGSISPWCGSFLKILLCGRKYVIIDVD